MDKDFPERLKELFEFGSMADIARRIDVPHATVRNYFQGRLPAPEVLIKIADKTDVSLNWLLTGAGPKFIGAAPQLDLGRFLEETINQMINKRLAGTDVQNLGTLDSPLAFDIEAAVREFDDPERVMGEWFRHEGRKYPKDYGIVFFQGWESYSNGEKIEAVRDAKKVLDRALKNK
jgi:transcriptional regulator with XRE-family HTH domain